MKIKNIFYVVTVLAIMNSSIHTMRPTSIHTIRPIDQELFVAIRNDQLEQVQTLLENGANPNSVDQNGWTPLHHAAFNDCTQIAGLLLAYDANPNSTNHENELIQGKPARFPFDLQNFHLNRLNINDETPLQLAIIKDHVNTVKLLLEHKANVNAMDKYSNTPLHYATKCDATNAIFLLLLANARIPENMSDNDIALLDNATRKINEIITIQNNIASLLTLQERKNQPTRDILLFLTMPRANDLADLEITRTTLLRLPSEILKQREELRLRQKRENKDLPIQVSALCFVACCFILTAIFKK